MALHSRLESLYPAISKTLGWLALGVAWGWLIYAEGTVGLGFGWLPSLLFGLSVALFWPVMVLSGVGLLVMNLV